MKKLLISSVMVAMFAGAPVVYADDAQHSGHVGAAAAKPATGKDVSAGQPDKSTSGESCGGAAGATMGKAQERMKQAQALMDKLHETKAPAERHRLMAEHTQAMRDTMSMMRGMGMGAMGAGHGMGMMGSGHGMGCCAEAGCAQDAGCQGMGMMGGGHGMGAMAAGCGQGMGAMGAEHESGGEHAMGCAQGAGCGQGMGAMAAGCGQGMGAMGGGHGMGMMNMMNMMGMMGGMHHMMDERMGMMQMLMEQMVDRQEMLMRDAK